MDTNIVLLEPGEWKWQESHRDLDYSNWMAGEPNGGDVENCVEKWPSESGMELWQHWNDRSCDYNIPHALCQGPHP